MQRSQLAHLIRAAAAVALDNDLVVIGSQAILGTFAHPPEELLTSMEVDLYPLNRPDRADFIDGAIGEGSMFNLTFGYYAQAVGEDTATPPAGWKQRLVPFRTRATNGATGWCLEVHDLVLAKAARGLPKDFRYLRVAIEANLVTEAVLLERLATMPVPAEVIAIIRGQIGQPCG